MKSNPIAKLCYLTVILCLELCISHSDQSCPPTHTLAQNPNGEVISNGCSKPSFITVEGEEDFTYCCDRHDACYAMCQAPKSYCDDDFKKCMHQLCDSKFGTSPNCKSAANTYAMGTGIFGQQGYIESQNEHCMCVPVDDVVDHYTNIVRNFYSLYAPDKADNVDAIMSKYISGEKQPTKLYRLYYGLHKKYDNAIHHTDGRRKMQNIPKPEL